VEDTDNSPFDSGTGGSKSTNSVGTAAYQTASEIKEKILALAAERIGCKPESITAQNGRYLAPGGKPMSFRDLMSLAVEQNRAPITHLSVYEPSRAPITSFAAQIAEVEVDPQSGRVKVKKLITVHDSGTVLNHLSYQGQVDGGVVTGLGFALMEDSSLVDGRMATANLGEFKLPTVADIPKLTTVLMEDAMGPTPFQGKAIAEIPNVPTAPAIANAIEDAVGVRLYDLPLTSEKIYKALNKG
jgi:CO/xanthine dehydrogenase Mo-binding subunit